MLAIIIYIKYYNYRNIYSLIYISVSVDNICRNCEYVDKWARAHLYRLLDP